MIGGIAGVLTIASFAFAQGLGWRNGTIPGGTLGGQPGVGGLGVPGQVPGGTLSRHPAVGGIGVPGQVPGGTLSAEPGVGGVGVPGQVAGGILEAPVCGGGPCTRVLFIPGLGLPVPGGAIYGGNLAAAP